MRICFENFRRKIESDQQFWMLMDLGRGYLESSIALAKYLATLEVREHGGIYHCMPVIFNAHQGVENFLKGATLAAGCKPLSSHHLGQLVNSFGSAVSDKALPPCFDFDKTTLELLIQIDSVAKPTETSRYLLDKSFEALLPGISILESDLLSIVKRIRDECIRIHIKFVQAYIPKPETFLVHPLNTWWEPETHFRKRIEIKMAEWPSPHVSSSH